MQIEGRKEIIEPDGIHPLPWPFSHGVKVGNLLFVAGQTALDPDMNLVGKDDPEAQARQIWTNIKTVVEAAGGKLTDVVRITTYVLDTAYIEPIHKVRREFFPDGSYPTAVMVQVSSLAEPDLLLETEAFAVIGSS